MQLYKRETNICCICQSEDSIVISKGIDFEYETVKDNFTFHKCNIVACLLKSNTFSMFTKSNIPRTLWKLF